MSGVNFGQIEYPKNAFILADAYAKIASRKKLSTKEENFLGDFFDLIQNFPKLCSLVSAAEVSYYLKEKIRHEWSEKRSVICSDWINFLNSINLENLCLAKEYYCLSVSLQVSDFEVERIIEILERSQSDLFLSLLVDVVDYWVFQKIEDLDRCSENYLKAQSQKISQFMQSRLGNEMPLNHELLDVAAPVSIDVVVSDPVLEAFITNSSIGFDCSDRDRDPGFWVQKAESQTYTDLIGFPVTALSLQEHIDLILEWGSRRSSKFVCVADAHLIIEVSRNVEVKKAVKMADLIPPGGMPLVWFMKIIELRSQERVSGMGLLLKLCELAPKHDVSLFLLGNVSVILERAKEKLESDFPDLNIVGMKHLPYRPLTPLEDEDLVRTINSSGAGIVLVSFSRSQQELWIAQHKGKIQAVVIGVGSEFPIYAEICRPIPEVIENIGFAWLYRILRDPRQFLMHYIFKIWLLFFLVGKQVYCQVVRSLRESFDS